MYRVEWNGIGPYNFTTHAHKYSDDVSSDYWKVINSFPEATDYAWDSIEAIDEMHRDSELHPIALSDIPGFIKGAHKCAFLSQEDAETWFGEFFQPLLDVGFSLSEIEVDESDVLMSRSGRQVAYLAETVAQ